MEEVNFKKMQKRPHYVGLKLSTYEREMVEKFCQENEISISDLFRFSAMKVMNQTAEK